jgi:hypothetical protein
VLIPMQLHAGMKSELVRFVRDRFDGGLSSSVVDNSGDMQVRFLDGRDVGVRREK